MIKQIFLVGIATLFLLETSRCGYGIDTNEDDWTIESSESMGEFHYRSPIVLEGEAKVPNGVFHVQVTRGKRIIASALGTSVWDGEVARWKVSIPPPKSGWPIYDPSEVFTVRILAVGATGGSEIMGLTFRRNP